MTSRFDISGERNAFWTSGGYSPWGRWMEISASNFQTVRVALPDVLASVVDIESTRPTTVRLPPGMSTTETPFADLAGKSATTSDGYVSTSFRIDSDGRFTWTLLQCTGSILDYGYLKKANDEIEIVSTPQPGFPLKEEFAEKFRTIRWGDCLYLCSTNPRRIQKFCRASLTPFRLREPGEAYGGYLRSTDCEKRPTGFPQLGAMIWLQFAIDEMRLSNEDSLFRTHFDRLVRRLSFHKPSSEEDFSNVDGLGNFLTR